MKNALTAIEDYLNGTGPDLNSAGPWTTKWNVPGCGRSVYIAARTGTLSNTFVGGTIDNTTEGYAMFDMICCEMAKPWDIPWSVDGGDFPGSQWVAQATIVDVDTKSKDLLLKMEELEIEDSFYKKLSFGTAGMRGILGPGTNRINVYTIRKATIAFATFLLNKFKDARDRGVVISHDNRHMSREFTFECAFVLNQMGFRAFIFDSLRPTPELSFAVRYLNAAGGINITASHNPKEYNGYKEFITNGSVVTSVKCISDYGLAQSHSKTYKIALSYSK